MKSELKRWGEGKDEIEEMDRKGGGAEEGGI